MGNFGTVLAGNISIVVGSPRIELEFPKSECLLLFMRQSFLGKIVFKQPGWQSLTKWTKATDYRASVLMMQYKMEGKVLITDTVLEVLQQLVSASVVLALNEHSKRKVWRTKNNLSVDY